MKNPWQEIQSRLGPIQFLDFTDFDLVHAHRELGRQVSEQVWRILDHRLADIKPGHLAVKIKQARECWGSLQERKERPGVADPLRIAIREYMICLEAWAEGLDLAHFSHPSLKSRITGGSPLTPYELGLLLQHDNVGCQTGIYRYASGAVQLWHTEEDMDWKSGSRFDKLRVASFQTGAEGRTDRFFAFIYPDLMPGSAFSWRDSGYIQAVDALLLNNPPQISGGVLANVVSWLSIRLGLSVTTADMLKLLHPFIDGYAMNLIWPENRTIQAARYEFAGDRVIKKSLAHEQGSFLFQVNIFSDRTDASLQAMEALSERSKSTMSKRLDRTVQALQNYKARENGARLQMDHFFRLIQSRAGRAWAYANKDVKAYFLCRVKPDEMEIWLGAGPARRGELPQTISQKL
jgi:hypothetical protein